MKLPLLSHRSVLMKMQLENIPRKNNSLHLQSFPTNRISNYSLGKRDGKLVWEKNQFAIRLGINCKHVEEFYFFFTTALPFLHNLLWCQTYFDNTCRTCHINKVIKESEHMHSNSCSPARVKITDHRYAEGNIHALVAQIQNIPRSLQSTCSSIYIAWAAALQPSTASSKLWNLG